MTEYQKGTIPSMSKPLLPPTSDFVFKLIFGDKRNVNDLIAFLQAVLDLPASEYDYITFTDPAVKKEFKDDKAGVLDVKIHTTSGYVIDVEIQVDPRSPLRERIMYYSSKMFTEQIGSGDDYDVICRVICIVITDYILVVDDAAYRHKFHLYDEKTGTELTNLLEVHTLELPKLPVTDDHTELWDWLRFFKVKKEEELKMVEQQAPALRNVVVRLRELSADDEARLLYEKRELARLDRDTITNRAVREAKQDEKRETARRMKADGMSIVSIAAYTDLPAAEIKTL
jgi:predicted transposase/invertase (TIGR01784 family)